MSEIPVQPPVFIVSTTVKIESSNHGPLRFGTWTVKNSAGIRRVGREKLEPRTFVEKLLSQLSLEPALTVDALKCWDEDELTAVAIEWWHAVDDWKAEPIPVDSFAALQSAVRRRIDDLSGHLDHLARIGNPGRLPEFGAAARLAREMERLSQFSHLGGVSPIHEAIRQTQLASRPFWMTEMAQANLGLASIHERLRELHLLRPNAIDLASLASPPRSITAQISELEKASRGMRDQFRWFESNLDATRFKDVLGSLDLSLYKGFAPSIVEFQSLAAKLKTPWIDGMFPESSVTGLAHIAALTSAAQVREPFTGASVTAIRGALGDWRELRMPWRLLADADLREKFYLDRGFDRSLIQLPEPAFSQAIAGVGLAPPLAFDVESHAPDAEEMLRRRMKQVYDLFFRLERCLRSYIDRIMSAKYGDDWEKHRCHGNGKIHPVWVQKREAAVRSGLKPERLIQYADFTDYAGLITRSDNWDEVFKDVFVRQENVRESFSRLGPVRLCTMHARPITKTELMLASAEITRLLIAIGAESTDEIS